MDRAAASNEPSFHEGEVALQCEVGVAERLARVGSQVIRSSMPEQHREFVALLPFIVVGSVDERGQPSASLLGAPPGFLSSPHPERLQIEALPMLGSALDRNLRIGAPLGLLGIQPHMRRRNRLNGWVSDRSERGFSVTVQQSFGNCPKYIHPRRAVYVGPPSTSETCIVRALDERMRTLVASADTFYLASAHPQALQPGTRSQGVDVSHRGGPKGFIHFVDEGTFIVPDFRGNNFFNTLGNLHLHAVAGLLFVDPANGDLLELEATTEVGMGSHPSAGPDTTGRILRFEVHLARYFRGASPVRFEPIASDP